MKLILKGRHVTHEVIISKNLINGFLMAEQKYISGAKIA